MPMMLLLVMVVTMFMNPRAGWDMEEMARLVAAFRSPTHCGYHSNKHKGGKRGEGGALVYYCGEFDLCPPSPRDHPS